MRQTVGFGSFVPCSVDAGVIMELLPYNVIPRDGNRSMCVGNRLPGVESHATRYSENPAAIASSRNIFTVSRE